MTTGGGPSEAFIGGMMDNEVSMEEEARERNQQE